MFHFLHTFEPQPVLISLGPVNIYWYGLFIVTGILAAILVILKLAEYYRLDKNVVIDAVFYLILGGIIGARLYHVILEWSYYLKNPLAIFKLWQGGLAIHGAIIAGLIIVWRFARRPAAAALPGTKTADRFWLLSALLVTGMSLAQAIGRLGNYFNQELFGRPTDLPWGIPIAVQNRRLEYYNSSYFHPAFLYEAIGNLLIFAALLLLHRHFIKKHRTPDEYFLLLYLALYSVLRFSLEFIRIDATPVLLSLRWPQVMSLIIIIAVSIYISWKYYKQKHTTTLNLNSKIQIPNSK
ncbi:MAG: prolipoprotein diacylglyceryl transferase [Planctomycetes bacterium]|jgi:phosphatidylglycerol:prolipoprotein diacylglycerol transferase|nr:prolipoprotein diacylglyceryl transferase [Planctomycetota bacterium]